jgi:hypothetical protein
VAKVLDGELAARSVSFVQFDASGKISRLDEYWGDIAEPPEWRRRMNIGAKIATTGTGGCDDEHKKIHFSYFDTDL